MGQGISLKIWQVFILVSSQAFLSLQQLSEKGLGLVVPSGVTETIIMSSQVIVVTSENGALTHYKQGCQIL